MLRSYLAIPVVLFALANSIAVRAQTNNISIPAWIETNNCALAPKFEAALDGKPVPVTAQLGPASDQVILVVLDLTSDLSLMPDA